VEKNTELILQKHNNVHKTLCGLMVSWIFVPLGMILKLDIVHDFLKTDATTFAIISMFLILAYTSLIMLFYYKANEYEFLLNNDCQMCENV